MAINKKLIHFEKFENFNSKKLSANKENTKYTLGVNGEIQTGSPEILYQSIVFIKDTKLLWTHGLLYSGETSESNVVKYVNQTLTDAQQAQARKNISAANVYTIYVDSLTAYYSEEWTSEEIDKLLNSDFVYIADSSNKILCTAVEEFSYRGYNLSGYPDIYIYYLFIDDNRVSINYDLISNDNDELEEAINNLVVGTYNELVDGADIYIVEGMDQLYTSITIDLEMQPISLLLLNVENDTERVSLLGPYVSISDEGQLISRFVGDFLNEIITCDIEDYTAENQIIHITPKNTTTDLSNYYTKQEIDSSKQDKLVSGTNIKTINGTSILGSGDIVISGGGNQVQSDWNETDATSPTYIANKPDITVTNYGDLKINSNASIDINALYGININSPIFRGYVDIISSTFKSKSSVRFEDSNGDYLASLIFNGNGTKFLSDDGTYKEISGNSSSSGAYPEIKHGTSDTTFTLTPNTFNIWDEVSSLDLSFGEETTGVSNEFLFQFTSGSEPTTLILPDSIKFNSDFTVEANKIYQISILNGLGTVMSWDI